MAIPRTGSVPLRSLLARVLRHPATLPVSLGLLATLLGVGGGTAVTATAAGWIAPEAEPRPIPDGRPEGQADAPETAAVAEAPPATAPPRPAGPDREAYVEAIVDRNIFDHRNLGGGDDSDGDGEASGETELDLTLLATVVAGDPERSAALIRRGGRNGPARGYGIGDRILDATITAIDADRVVLRRRDGELETLVGEYERGDRTRRARRPSRRKSDDAIAEVGKDHYEVDRSFVDELLSDTRGLRKLGRARPYKRDGEVIGFRLSRIRRNSLGRKVGLRSGDVITAVNGTKLNTTRSALSLMSQLGTARRFEVEVRKRGGGNRTVTVDLR